MTINYAIYLGNCNIQGRPMEPNKTMIIPLLFRGACDSSSYFCLLSLSRDSAIQESFVLLIENFPLLAILFCSQSLRTIYSHTMMMDLRWYVFPTTKIRLEIMSSTAQETCQGSIISYFISSVADGFCSYLCGNWFDDNKSKCHGRMIFPASASLISHCFSRCSKKWKPSVIQ